MRGDVATELPRAAGGTGEASRAVAAEILSAVREGGDAEVGRLAAELDGWSGGGFALAPGEASAAVDALDPALRQALERAADQVRWFHERARPSDWREQRDGARLGVRHQPLARVGVYVPGGRARYPSTALMTVLPARVAGVSEVVVCTPPGPDRAPDPTVLAAVELAGGADHVFCLGGAQAVAAMAYGTESVPACDKVCGPGNEYVSAAKQLAAAEGACGIDAPAGATEVAIVADGTASPELVAADLVAQAEHDPQAACLLITPSPALADAVEPRLEAEVAATRHRERVTAALDGQGRAVLVEDLDHAVAVANAYAAEHLEVQTEDAADVAERVHAAGAVFVGSTTPVALGDYCAGPNHTLPTGGAARFTGGLRTDDFLVPVNWVEYSTDGLAELASVVDALSAAEDLPAHARAVQARTDAAAGEPARG